MANITVTVDKHYASLFAGIDDEEEADRGVKIAEQATGDFHVSGDAGSVRSLAEDITLSDKDAVLAIMRTARKSQ